MLRDKLVWCVVHRLTGKGGLGDQEGIMENKMETTIVYPDYIGIMENKMETTRNYEVLK